MLILTEEDVFCLGLSQDGLKYSQQRLGQLLLQVVLCVDGNCVLQHKDWVLKWHAEQTRLACGPNIRRKGAAQIKSSYLDNKRGYFRPLTSCTPPLPLQPWWWRKELCLPGLGRCQHLFSSSCKNIRIGESVHPHRATFTPRSVVCNERTSQPAPRAPVCQRTPAQCAWAPWWWQADWCQCGCTAGQRSLLWREPQRPGDPWQNTPPARIIFRPDKLLIGQAVLTQDL